MIFLTVTSQTLKTEGTLMIVVRRGHEIADESMSKVLSIMIVKANSKNYSKNSVLNIW
jgi:hypothetical protein